MPTVYGKPNTSKQEMVANLFGLFLSNPKMLQAITDKSLSKDEQQQAFIQELVQDPNYAKQFIQALLQTGIIQI